MTVGDEVRSGLDHWSRQEWRPALWHATEALNKTADKRYPALDEGAAFRQTLRDDVDIFAAMAAGDIDFVGSRFPLPIPSDQPDGRPDIADLMFAVHRYLHVDEAEMPAGCQVVPPAEGVSMFVIANGRLWLRATAAIAMLTVSVLAPENEGQPIPESYFLSWRNYDFLVSASWGEGAEFRRLVASVPIQRYTLDFGNAWDAWAPVR
ncbi:MAG: hypothetical protein KIH64_016500 [Mycobacterium sp.]|nr:hypothetical protein [Mycobacterium sp.]